MRNNQPVSGKEIELEDGQTIVSRTDTKGIIRYINRDFLRISGFTEAEPFVAAQHHSPGYAGGAFADLWATLKAVILGRHGVEPLQKRRSLWVEAHATPVFEQGKVAGYMSVRRKASREQIATAERHYAAFRSGRAMGLVVRQGEVQRLSMNLRYNPLWRMSLMQRLLMSAAGVGVFALCMMWMTQAEVAASTRWTIFFAGLVASFYSAWWLAHDIGSRLKDAEQQFRAIGSGDYQQNIAIDRNDEVGAVLLGLKSMQIRLASSAGAQTHRRKFIANQAGIGRGGGQCDGRRP